MHDAHDIDARSWGPALLCASVLTLAACGGAETDAATSPSPAPHAAPVPAPRAPPAARPGTLLANARLCVDVDDAGELAREGMAIRVHFEPCWCDEVFTCEARADDGAIDLYLSVGGGSGCDACVEGQVTCTVPPMRAGTMRVLNDGRFLSELRVTANSAAGPRHETCGEAEAPVTLVRVRPPE